MKKENQKQYLLELFMGLEQDGDSGVAINQIIKIGNYLSKFGLVRPHNAEKSIKEMSPSLVQALAYLIASGNAYKEPFKRGVAAILGYYDTGEQEILKVATVFEKDDEILSKQIFPKHQYRQSNQSRVSDEAQRKAYLLRRKSFLPIENIEKIVDNKIQLKKEMDEVFKEVDKNIERLKPSEKEISVRMEKHYALTKHRDHMRDLENNLLASNPSEENAAKTELQKEYKAMQRDPVLKKRQNPVFDAIVDNTIELFGGLVRFSVGLLTFGVSEVQKPHIGEHISAFFTSKSKTEKMLDNVDKKLEQHIEKRHPSKGNSST